MKVIEKQNKKKQDILNQILPLMDEDGIENITIRDICDVANISVGSFYHYFGSKEGIYDELFRQMDNYFVENEPVICDGNNTLEMLERFARCYFDNAIKWGYYCNRAVLLNSLEESSFLHHSTRRPFYRILHQIVSKGIELGQMRDDLTAPEIESMLLILLRGYGLAWAKELPENTNEQLFQKQIELFITSLYAENC